MFGIRAVLIVNLFLILFPLTLSNEKDGGCLKYTSKNSTFCNINYDSLSQLENWNIIDPNIICNRDGVIKILAIGNSFSEDAIENYLFELAAAENIKMVIGNLVIGGASLEQHWQNANENSPLYNYRKIFENGDRTDTPNTTLEYGIRDENWDYISFQQVSGKSGKYVTFIIPLTALLEYVRNNTSCNETKYVLHQTWAYDKESNHPDFTNYNNDQEIMYKSIVETYSKVGEKFNINLIVPSGTAIQNGRNTIIGDNFTRDGYHLNFVIGRYTAACTWFESITGINVVGNSFKPSELSRSEAEIAQLIAHAANQNPTGITYTNSVTNPVLKGQ